MRIKKFDSFLNESNETELFKLADSIYQDSIYDLEEYWDIVKDNNDPDVLLDQMVIFYEDDKRIADYLKKNKISYKILWSDKHKDSNQMTFADLLSEFIENGLPA